LDALAAGEEGAFAVLYQRHRDWIVRLAFRFTGHEADALDVLQEVCTYLVRKALAPGGLKLTAALTTFLYPAVKNLSLAARRKRCRFVGSDEALENTIAPPMPPPSDVDDPRAALAGLLGSLPATQREVALMRFVDDLTLEEIATALAIPLGTVKSRLHHALAQLRASPRLQRYFDQA